jgi:hypothetical protein
MGVTVNISISEIGSAVSLLTFVLFVAISLAGVRTRRLSREARELREIREINVDALRYIYNLEIAADQAAQVAGVTLNVEKPESLKRSYLIERAGDNSELSHMADVAKMLQQANPTNFQNLIDGKP